MKSTYWGWAVAFLALPAKIKVRTVRLKGQARTGRVKGIKKELNPIVRTAPKPAASIPAKKALGEGIKKIPPTETALRIRLNPNSWEENPWKPTPSIRVNSLSIKNPKKVKKTMIRLLRRRATRIITPERKED